MSGSSYSQSNNDLGETVFTVLPAKASIPILALLFSASMAGIFLGMQMADRGGLNKFGFILGFFGVCALMYWLRELGGKNISTFRISSTSVFARNGDEIPISKIHRLVIKNSLNGTEIISGSPTMVGGSGYIGAGLAAGSVIGSTIANAAAVYANQINKKNASKSYRLDVEAGGKAHMLAESMDEVTSNGLLNDVLASINGRVSSSS